MENLTIRVGFYVLLENLLIFSCLKPVNLSSFKLTLFIKAVIS